MYLLVLGIVLLLLKYLGIGPLADWSWWWMLTPFVLAVVWWSWADSSGYTKRKAMEQEAEKMQERRDRTKSALDSNYKRKK
ncbi:MAG: TIGR04438 family Trp-rich protein [Rhodoferax sp.]|jgi:small Trp-rich protein|uniref:TIGR04438 family Trp-rich protein n=1 Tax=Rhodoferax sp. TaxID=50421 RepID=UPI002737210F|nr:TIGR04438 family Trp-rich protein [Rhodoferax sp.]MDP2677445.1 TIGR04438 family Trp-rich protein [Rhodoferax sp.]